jgi:hypothetical protein
MPNQLNEGLRAKDLEHFVNDTFLIDTFKSKMGEDKDVSVLSFKVKDRLPALDLMEFIERGYDFVLDADISSGEESDGKYSVFVEIERDRKLAERIEELVSGISKLTGIDGWRFRYHKEWQGKPYSMQAISETVPSSPEAYIMFLQETKNSDVKDFLSDVLYDSIVFEGDIMTLHRPFVDGLKFEIKNIGDYKSLMNESSSEIKLDQQSNAQTVFLSKIFKNYEVVKLGENYMVRRNDQSILIRPL